jgi:hypothetical protein
VISSKTVYWRSIDDITAITDDAAGEWKVSLSLRWMTSVRRHSINDDAMSVELFQHESKRANFLSDAFNWKLCVHALLSSCHFRSHQWRRHSRSATLLRRMSPFRNAIMGLLSEQTTGLLNNAEGWWFGCTQWRQKTIDSFCENTKLPIWITFNHLIPAHLVHKRLINAVAVC